MRLFVDTSVILAAAGSSRGASRFVFEHAQANGWSLVTAAYCIDEARRNVGKFGARAVKVLNDALVPGLSLVPTELAFNRILVFPKAKDRPVLLSALGTEADCLLTLDEGDFQKVIGAKVYGMEVSTPGRFLMVQRERRPI